MGLDIYLYHFLADPEEILRKEEEYYEASAEIWKSYGGYKNMSEEEKDLAQERCDDLKIQMGLGEYGEDPRKVRIERNSKLYPDHYFKIGYFRSSYNNSGINAILNNSIGKSLYDIFTPPATYSFNPDWKSCNKAAVDILNEFRKYVKENPLRASFITSYGNQDTDITSGKDAIALLIDKKEKATHNPTGWWSNSQGMFFMNDRPEVHAVIHGKNTLGQKGVYIIYEDDLDHYVQALEIVIETINYVLKHDDLDRWHLNWSS